MRLTIATFTLLVACHATAVPVLDSGSPAPADGGRDAGMVNDSGSALDAGHDAGGIDAGQDAGPACECSSGPCCDGCDFAPVATECAWDEPAIPNRCFPTTYVTPAFYGWVETITHCGPAGACDGATTTVDHKFGCPSGYYCRVRTATDGQAICDH